jgi:DNA-binding response OmpR family regulator
MVFTLHATAVVVDDVEVGGEVAPVVVEVVEPPAEGDVVEDPIPSVSVVLEEPIEAVDPDPVVVVVSAAESRGASTWIGATGRSLTRASAALTICQVTVVASRVTTTQAPTMLHLLISSLSQLYGTRPLNEGSSFSQGGEVPCRVPITCSLMARIVLIEDDVDIRRLVADALAARGHDVESAAVALEGLQLAVKGTPDLVIMDLGLPDLDGSELLRMIRAVSQVPIIVITARGADDVVVKTLDSGADDYLVKPFSIAQLEARVRAVLRRGSSPNHGELVRIGELSIDPAAREATLSGSVLELSPKEFDLLRVLAERAGEVVSKRELMAEVWREPYGGAERTVDVHLSWLRSKLGETAQDPRYLRTVHGVGVKLVDPSR